MADLRKVIVTPGRVAYTTVQAQKQFTDVPQTVVWNDYLEELLTVHGDIEVVSEKKKSVERPTVAVEK